MSGPENRDAGQLPGEVPLSALEGFPLLMAALVRELKDELRRELSQGQWLNQEQSVLGRNRHVAACKRLIRRDSTDAYYDGTMGHWLLRSSAVDAEVQRRNRELARNLPPSEPPPAMAPVLAAPRKPLPGLAQARTPESDPEDETGIYERSLLERFGGTR